MERMQAPFGKRGTRSGSSGKIIPGVICEVGNHIIESQDSPISRGDMGGTLSSTVESSCPGTERGLSSCTVRGLCIKSPSCKAC